MVTMNLAKTIVKLYDSIAPNHFLNKIQNGS